MVQTSVKDQCCDRLGTSSCIVCSMSYSRSGANVAGGVEIVMVIIVECQECSTRHSYEHVTVSEEQTCCRQTSAVYNS